MSPAGLIISEMTPSNGATTSSTTFSVSISTITSSCLINSPSFFTQLAIVPSATDSGNVGDLISIAILFSIFLMPQLSKLFVVDCVIYLAQQLEQTLLCD